MAAAAELSEPRVLAATKQELFSTDQESGYVVTDTQFVQDRWLDNQHIDQETKSILAPFNHVRVGSGYPDLVGVGHLDGETRALVDEHVGSAVADAIRGRCFSVW